MKLESTRKVGEFSENEKRHDEDHEEDVHIRIHEDLLVVKDAHVVLTLDWNYQLPETDKAHRKENYEQIVKNDLGKHLVKKHISVAFQWSVRKPKILETGLCP